MRLQKRHRCIRNDTRFRQPDRVDETESRITTTAHHTIHAVGAVLCAVDPLFAVRARVSILSDWLLFGDVISRVIICFAHNTVIEEPVFRCQWVTVSWWLMPVRDHLWIEIDLQANIQFYSTSKSPMTSLNVAVSMASVCLYRKHYCGGCCNRPFLSESSGFGLFLLRFHFHSSMCLFRRFHGSKVPRPYWTRGTYILYIQYGAQWVPK